MLNKMSRGIGKMRIALQRETITAAMVHETIDRLVKGSYGKCSRCGVKISPVRLAANPTAEFCPECQAQNPQQPYIFGRIFVYLPD